MLIINDNKNKVYNQRQQIQRNDSSLHQFPRITVKTKFSISFLCLFDGLRTPSIRRLVRKPNMLCDKPILTFDPSFYAPSSKSAMKEIYDKSLSIPCEIAVDPSVQTVLALLRRYTSSIPPQRVILHYCGYGVLQPNKDGCIFFFTEDRQRYKPLKIQNIVNACACPICFIIDCPNAAALKPHLLNQQDFFAFFSCAEGEALPLSMDARLDIFSSCLLQPFEAALNFHKSPRQHNSVFTEQLMPIEEHHDFLLSLFNCLLDAIIFETQEGSDICNEIASEIGAASSHGNSPKSRSTKDQFLNMISPTIASLTKGFALAQRVMLSFNLHPTAIPELKPMGMNHLWEFWDLVLDFAATVRDPTELEKIVFALFIESFKKFPRIAHIPMFSMWIEKENFRESACESLLEFLEAKDKKKRRKSVCGNAPFHTKSSDCVQNHIYDRKQNQSEPHLFVNNDLDKKSLILTEHDAIKEAKVLNSIKFGNKTFISYSDFDEYDKFNDLSYDEVSDSYYSEGNEEEDKSDKSKKEESEDDASDSYEDEESDDELICFDYDIIRENLYERAMLGRSRKGDNFSLIRSRIAALSPISSKIIENQTYSFTSLLILAKIIASTSIGNYESKLKYQRTASNINSIKINQQDQLNFSILQTTDELKIGMLVTCCEMKKKEIPASFNRITQICIEHLNDCAPFSLILLGLFLQFGGKLAFSTAATSLASIGNIDNSEYQIVIPGVVESETDNLAGLDEVDEDDDDDDENDDFENEHNKSETLFFDKIEPLLSNHRVDIRASAVFLLGKTKECSQKAIDKLLLMLENEKEDNLVRGQVLFTLASFDQTALFSGAQKSLFSGKTQKRIQTAVNNEFLKVQQLKKNASLEADADSKNLLISAAMNMKNQLEHLNKQILNVNNSSFQSAQLNPFYGSNSRQSQTKDFSNPFLDYLLNCVASEGFSDTLDSNIFKAMNSR